MAYAEKRGKGPRPWRVKYKIPGGEASQSGFETKQAALAWGRDQEAKIRAGTWTDPGAGAITVSEWIDRWQAMQDVGPSTMANREYRIRRFILPYWGKRKLNSLTGEDITVWEHKLHDVEGMSRSTAKDARGLLHTILGDAAAAKPPLIPFNPAVRPRNRGRRTGRRCSTAAQRAWATPLEVLLVAERAALLPTGTTSSPCWSRSATPGCGGARRSAWSAICCSVSDQPRVAAQGDQWPLSPAPAEGRLVPQHKRGAVRASRHPAFLAELLTAQARTAAVRLRRRARRECRYVFLGPDGGHHRRSNFARRVFRPACDGRHPPANGTGGRLVVVDAAAWPGIPVASWPPAVPGKPFVPPSGRGSPRLISTENSARCQACGYAVRLRLDGRTIAHKNAAGDCPGSGEQPASDAPLACWLPVKDGLTPHGLRHSHKTWMAEDGIPEILAEQRLGHQVPGMRGLYTHASQRMRDELTADLLARWEESLRERAAIDPHSTVPLLDTLLAPFRTEPAGHPGSASSG